MQWSVRSDQNGSTLAHYGVKGMQWGVRKEYELKGKSKSKKQKPQTAKGKMVEKRNQPSSYRMSDRERTEVYIHTNGKEDYETLINQSKEYYYLVGEKGEYASPAKAKERFDALPKIDSKKPFSEEQTRFAVNYNAPEYERKNNCFECSMAFEMRKRGYDVQARNVMGGYDFEILHAFDITDSFTITSGDPYSTYKEMYSECIKYGEGARGCLGITYANGQSGHSMSWVVENGQFKIIDNQSNRAVGKDTFMYSDGSVRVYRLDNAEVLPGVTDFVEAHEIADPNLAFELDTDENKKARKKAAKKAERKAGKNSVDKVLKSIGSDIAKFVSDGMKAVAKFFKNPLNIQNQSSISSPTKKKDSRSFIEKLFNVKTKSDTKTGNGRFTRLS